MPELRSRTYLRATGAISQAIGRNEWHMENDDNELTVASLAKLNKDLEQALEMLHDDYWGPSFSKDKENAAESI